MLSFNKMSKQTINKCIPYVVLLIFVFILLKSIFLGSGVLNNEDSANPISATQVKMMYDIGKSTYSFNNFIPYASFLSGAATPLNYVQLLFSKIGIVHQFPSIFIFSLFFIAAVGSYKLTMHYLNERIPSLLAALCYVTTPVFFNYTVFGWHFVIMSLALLPFTLLNIQKSIDKNDIKYILYAAIIASFSFVQIQSVIWYAIVVFVMFTLNYGMFSSKLRSIRASALFSLLMIMLNFHSILPVLMSSFSHVSSSEYVMSAASLGTTAHFYPLNTLVLFGGLFNFQYENILLGANMTLVPYLLVLLSFILLLVGKFEKIILIMLVLYATPFLVYIVSENRFILSYIPFSNVIRDLARFSVLSAFSLPFIIGFSYYNIKSIKSNRIQLLFKSLFFSLLVANISPWFFDNVFYSDSRELFDSRLIKFKNIPEFDAVENMLNTESDYYRVLYLPLAFNSTIKMPQHPVYYHGVRDIYAIYSPKPGLFSFEDRDLHHRSNQKQALDSMLSGDFFNEPSNVKYLIHRKKLSSFQVSGVDYDRVSKNILMQASRSWEKVDENSEIEIFLNPKYNSYFIGNFEKSSVNLPYLKNSNTEFIVSIEPRDLIETIKISEPESANWKIECIAVKCEEVVQFKLLGNSSGEADCSKKIKNAQNTMNNYWLIDNTCLSQKLFDDEVSSYQIKFVFDRQVFLTIGSAISISTFLIIFSFILFRRQKIQTK
jgi:hypothetical protein